MRNDRKTPCNDNGVPANARALNRRSVLTGASVVAAAGAMTGPSALATQETIANRIAGRSVLITGSSSGFGRLTALHLARNGATVIASMRNYDGGKRPEAQELMDIARQENTNLSVIDLDVTDPAQVSAGVTNAEAIAGGGLDVLVNNAGIAIAGPVEMHDEEALALQMQTNLFGYHRMARAVLPKMRRNGAGLLFHVSSQLGRIILPNIGMYCATKFGLEAMFEAMAYELAPFGVESTIIEPGGYPTKVWENGRRYFADLTARTDDALEGAYAEHLQLAQGLLRGGGDTDPMDVARAIAEIMALPAGQRPLRRPVHPRTQSVEALNAAIDQIQDGVLSNGAYGPWRRAVAD